MSGKTMKERAEGNEIRREKGETPRSGACCGPIVSHVLPSCL